MAMVVAMLGVLLLSSLGAALTMTMTSETLIAGSARRAQDLLYAADLGLERALDDLRAEPDWEGLAAGSSRSSAVDGASNGVRTLMGGATLDLDQRVAIANCGKTSCTFASITAVTSARPWGVNNPVWRLYAHGPMSLMAAPAGTNAPYYVVVFLADDPAQSPAVLWLRAEAFGPAGSHHTVDEAVARDSAGLHVVSWRDRR